MFYKKYRKPHARENCFPSKRWPNSFRYKCKHSTQKKTPFVENFYSLNTKLRDFVENLTQTLMKLSLY